MVWFHFNYTKTAYSTSKSQIIARGLFSQSFIRFYLNKYDIKLHETFRYIEVQYKKCKSIVFSAVRRAYKLIVDVGEM